MRTPSTAAVPVVRKFQYHLGVWRQYRHTSPIDFAIILAELEDLLARFRTATGRDAESVLEIGYGQRLWRLLGFHALGLDVQGVDAEVAVIRGRPSEYLRMFRTNGLERLAKTLVRRAIFDKPDRRRLTEEIRRQGLREDGPRPEVFAVGNAADFTPDGPVDLVFSIDVFEHIDRTSLERLVPRMADWLVVDGVAFILAEVWTGFHGGHAVEWKVPGEHRSEPWEHLRANRFPANTHLNKMTRNEYRALFTEPFEIVDEVDRPRGPEVELLTPDVRAELARYSDEDLLDGSPLFVLRRR